MPAISGLGFQQWAALALMIVCLAEAAISSDPEENMNAVSAYPHMPRMLVLHVSRQI